MLEEFNRFKMVNFNDILKEENIKKYRFSLQKLDELMSKDDFYRPTKKWGIETVTNVDVAKKMQSILNKASLSGICLINKAFIDIKDGELEDIRESRWDTYLVYIKD